MIAPVGVGVPLLTGLFSSGLGQSVLFALCGELRTEKVLFYFSGVCKSAVAHYPAGVITSYWVLQPVKRKRGG